MKRTLPFDIDKKKKDYLLRNATTNICSGCTFAGSHECGLVVKSEKRTIVDDIQDCFEIVYMCPRSQTNYLRVEKFFLPNSKFEEKYFEKVIDISKSKMIINGSIILEELLNWGRISNID